MPTTHPPAPGSSDPAAGRARTATPCAVLATGSPERARAAARAAGLEPLLTVAKADGRARLVAARRRARECGVRVLVIHSDDWVRERQPQSFELLAARLGLPECRIIAGDGTLTAQLGRGRLAARLGALPLELGAGLARTAGEAARLARVMSRPAPPTRRAARSPPGDTVLAVWLGSRPTTHVGGAVTHVSGILSGFRSVGLRVVLVTMDEPPPQVADAIDDLVRLRVLPRHARVTEDVGTVMANREARAVVQGAAAALRPAFIYQRNDPATTAGVDAGCALGVPVALEFNSSVGWTRANWYETRRLGRALLPHIVCAERFAVTRADLVAAVSTPAARIAVEIGAAPERVVVVPNAVDIGRVDAARRQSRGADGRGGTTVGWVGSFGVWHGARVLVKAMAQLPDGVGAVMIGDGRERGECQELARRLGVADRIEWTGALTHAAAVARLSECDVLASPHVPLDDQAFFGSPTKLFEYVAIGRPIVASSLDQLAEVLEDGRTAVLVRPGDPPALAAGIAAVLREPDQGRGLGDAARLEAERAHRWDDRARSILERLEITRGCRR
jgi:glycosyltransferase involved in cell wall biosynthesis